MYPVLLKWKLKVKNYLSGQQSGLATIEVIMIIIILIALAIMFKDVIIDFVQNLLGGIEDQSSTFNPTTLAG